MPGQRARIIVGISGSSAPHLGAAFLATLRRRGDVESHLVLSVGARRSIELEMRIDPAEVERLADVVYDASGPSAPIASSSFPALGMVIIPCSMRTLAAVAARATDTMVAGVADVTLRARRPLVLVTRETPLSYIHVRNMTAATMAGATVMPPILGYSPASPNIEEVISRFCGKVLDELLVGPAAERAALG